jgi:hypothetical protein
LPDLNSVDKDVAEAHRDMDFLNHDDIEKKLGEVRNKMPSSLFQKPVGSPRNKEPSKLMQELKEK